MTELETKQVKFDNWGIFFLQRLKHFFNRTDYCDLTLQFQDNAQLKVHRLVLSVCTKYFELLEKTCEMYEDCLVMPDDLQEDVVVPIVNFMYTGQLKFRMDLLERLYQTSQIMNMPVLTKLLEAHRNQVAAAALKPPSLNYSSIKRSYSKAIELTPRPKQTSQNNISVNKRSHIKAFGNVTSAHKEAVKKSLISSLEKTNDKDSDVIASPASFTAHNYGQPSVPRKVTLGELYNEKSFVIGNNEYFMRGNQIIKKKRISSTNLIVPEIVSAETKFTLGEPRPTRYLPEELDPITQKDVYNEEILVIGNNEYIMRGNQFIKKKRISSTNLIVPEIVSAETEDSLGSDYATQDAMEEQTLQKQRMIMKKTVNTNQPIQIVVPMKRNTKP